MSSHLIRRDQPPPGASSFTRIRLGWINEEQVEMVRPGEEKRFVLRPLERGGKPLAVKIPLPGNDYYLVENRQPIGCDAVLPDSGLLVLKVRPNALEGTGTVIIMDADPASPRFSHPTYLPGKSGRDLFQDKENNVAVVPLSMKGEDMEVVVTTPQGALSIRRP
jgi:hypothetical protein